MPKSGSLLTQLLRQSRKAFIFPFCLAREIKFGKSFYTNSEWRIQIKGQRIDSPLFRHLSSRTRRKSKRKMAAQTAFSKVSMTAERQKIEDQLFFIRIFFFCLSLSFSLSLSKWFKTGQWTAKYVNVIQQRPVLHFLCLLKGEPENNCFRTQSTKSIIIIVTF